MNLPDNVTFRIKTLGCKVNQYESELIREGLLRRGCAETEGEKADYYIINSCTVTHNADAETRNAIRRFNRLNPDGKIIVAGCYAETPEDREELSRLPGVVSLVRNRDKRKIGDIVSNRGQEAPFRQNISGFKGHDRAFVKIQDGCDHNCSYCKIPLVRGRSVSRPLADIIDEIRQLTSAGFKETVLTGICLGAWGLDLGGDNDLAFLLKEIEKIDGEFRIRLSSIEPVYVKDSLIDLVAASKKICQHLHIPLQSGDDKILKKMKRPYTVKKYLRLIKKIRKKMPRAAITTDILTGFPGEDERSFRNTCRSIKKLRPSRAHIFTYSRRKGTEAFYLPDKTGPEAVKRRYKKLEKLTRSFQAKYAERFKKKTVRVLIEKDRDKDTGLLTGYTDEYVKVLVRGAEDMKARLLKVKDAIPVVVSARK